MNTSDFVTRMRSPQVKVQSGRIRVRDPLKKTLAPRKVKERKKIKTKEAKVAEAEGQRAIDSRVATATTTPMLEQLTVKQQDSSIDVRVVRGSRSIEHLALGVVLAALKKGWVNQLHLTEGGYVYGAYVYLVQALYSAMEGTVPLLQLAPAWFWHITQALLPTTEPFKTSYVTYKWVLEEGQQSAVPPAVEVMSGLAVALGSADFLLPTVNGFYQITAPVYTSELGQAAIKSLFEVWKGTGLLELSSYFESPLKHDTSAFAALFPELGGSEGSAGAMATTLYSERVIPCPLLSKFGLYQTDSFRGWAFCGRSSGTPGYVLPRMLEMKKIKEVRNRIPPIFKFYDFNEFFEVLSLTVGYALERQLTSNVSVPSGTCPLTAQQVAVLLRQVMLPAFSNEMAIDLNQSGINTIGYLPMSCGTNGVSSTALSTPMLMPMFLAETIRAATRKLVKLPGGVLDMVPILAQRETLNEVANYSYGGVSTVYTPPGSEVPFNLINMSYDDGGTTKYVVPNGRQISEAADVWNDWIKSLSTFLTPLTSPAQASGPPLLSSVTLTRQVKYSEPQSQIAQIAAKKPIGKQMSKKDLGLKVDVKRKVSVVDPAPEASYYRDFGVLGVTSTNTPLLPCWKYQRVMILPVWSSFEATFEGAIPFRQVFQVEPFKLSTSGYSDEATSAELPTLFDMHKAAAILDTKTELASESEIAQDFRILNEHGEGGFVTSLAGIFSEDILGLKGGKAIASAIGAATGW